MCIPLYIPAAVCVANVKPVLQYYHGMIQLLFSPDYKHATTTTTTITTTTTTIQTIILRGVHLVGYYVSLTWFQQVFKLLCVYVRVF